MPAEWTPLTVEALETGLHDIREAHEGRDEFGRWEDNIGGDEDEATLKWLQEAFVEKEVEDKGLVLETIQTFLAARRLRLVEDLLMLALSQGEDLHEGQGGCCGDRRSCPEPPKPAPGGGGIPHAPLSPALSALQLFSLRKGLLVGSVVGGVIGKRGAVGGDILATAEAVGWGKSRRQEAGGKGQDRQGVRSVLGSSGEGEVEAELQSAGFVSVEKFFTAWTTRFSSIMVPFEEEKGGQGLQNTGGGGKEGGGGTGPKGKDDREIQSARDVERDTLVVNGTLVVGSSGYGAVVARVAGELKKLTSLVTGGSGGGGSVSTGVAGSVGGRVALGEACCAQPVQLHGFAKLILKTANRTESGGLSFDAIQQVLSLCPRACNGSVLVVPDSSKAEPLKITIKAEGFLQKNNTPFGPVNNFSRLEEGVHTFGICAYIEAVTVYCLYSEDMETVWARLRATFHSCLRLPVSPPLAQACSSSDEIGYRGASGGVLINVVEEDPSRENRCATHYQAVERQGAHMCPL